MSYVDGYVLPVPKAKLAEYKRLTRLGCKVWLEHGALEYVECVADDVPEGKVTSFPRSVKLEPDEVVIFSYVRYRSRAHRDRVNAKVMADPRLAGLDPKTMPFDPKRLLWGGFKPLIRKLAEGAD